MYKHNQLLQKIKCEKSIGPLFKFSAVSKIRKEVKKYTETINLPKTSFPLWLKGDKRILEDERIMKEEEFSNLYSWQRQEVKGSEFILHDGPPYANGMPHMGHAINKVLKDITCRHKLLQGYKIHYKPGWDCHGLPIELKAMAGVDALNISPLHIRHKARAFAKEAVELQRTVFKSWGVMADWQDGCYFTNDKSYIQNQLKQFHTLFLKGLIYRDLKPVYWSSASRTALAEAELEYNEEHKSIAVHVRLPISSFPSEWCIDVPVYAMVWTTTPWTLPANEAIAYNPALQYCLVSVNNSNELYLVANDLLLELQTKLNKSITKVKSFQGTLLKGITYKHPIDQRGSLPFLEASHVTAAKGTGLVHTAPAHGPDDFLVAKQNNLPVICNVDENGCYTSGVDSALVGLSVLNEGTEEVLSILQINNAIVYREEFVHSYPYDWRTKSPVILRASQQWFIDTDAIKTIAIDALKDVKIIPDRGASGLLSQLERRPYWCISRQRVWGVPVPILYNKNNNEPIITRSLVDHYCNLLKTVGEDFWWCCSLKELVPESIQKELKLNLDDIEKGQDILDIWFDSGLSWSSVLQGAVADVYLEGIDQFTGWFQSSLMTSVALKGIAPYKKIFVHGFAVDENGHKMSKSIGNVVNPQDIIKGKLSDKNQPVYGVDTLRWWVACHATQHVNVPVSLSLLNSSYDTVQKIRSVLRFLLGTISDIAEIDRQPQLRLLDQYMLHSLLHLSKQVDRLYEDFEYNKVCTTVHNFVTNQVSSLYCHVTKDRLYCNCKDSEDRRAAQVTLSHILEVVLHLIAPILPVLAEEVYSYHPNKQGSQCFFHQIRSKVEEGWHNSDICNSIDTALMLKKEVSKSLPLNCNNFEFSITVDTPAGIHTALKMLQDEEYSCSSDLVEILQVSSVKLLKNVDCTSQFVIKVNTINGKICQRCRCREVGQDELCVRCHNVIQSLR